MGFLLVYDIKREVVHEHRGVSNKIEKHTAQPVTNKILVGNKIDLESQRQVSTVDCRRLAGDTLSRFAPFVKRAARP